jgi:hypothetical protein
VLGVRGQTKDGQAVPAIHLGQKLLQPRRRHFCKLYTFRTVLFPLFVDAGFATKLKLESQPMLAPSFQPDSNRRKYLEALVDFVIDQQVAKVSAELTVQELAMRFVIEDDAEFALDRVLGGIVRAATGNPANCPNRTKDPVAWVSYQRAVREPEIVRAIRPEYGSKG